MSIFILQMNKIEARGDMTCSSLMASEYQTQAGLHPSLPMSEGSSHPCSPSFSQVVSLHKDSEGKF